MRNACGEWGRAVRSRGAGGAVGGCAPRAGGKPTGESRRPMHVARHATAPAQQQQVIGFPHHERGREREKISYAAATTTTATIILLLVCATDITIIYYSLVSIIFVVLDKNKFKNIYLLNIVTTYID